MREDFIYKLLKNVVIRGDRRFLLDLYTPADMNECIGLKNFLYFCGAL